MAQEDQRLRKQRGHASRASTDGPQVLTIELREPGHAARFQFRPGDPLEVAIRITTPRALASARLRIQARRRDNVCIVELLSPGTALAPGEHEIIADLGHHRLGPSDLHWSAVLEEKGNEIASLASNPVPMGIVSHPNDVLERGGLRHRTTWSIRSD